MQSQKVQEQTSGSLLRVKMRNGFFLPYCAAAELHNPTHLLSSSCPWGKPLLPVLHPQCCGVHPAQYRLLLSQLGPHFSTISLYLRPPHSCSAPEPHHCDRSSSCYINQSGLKATTSLWGKSILLANFFCLPSSQRGFSACGEGTTELTTVILKRLKNGNKNRRSFSSKEALRHST